MNNETKGSSDFLIIVSFVCSIFDRITHNTNNWKLESLHSNIRIKITSAHLSSWCC